MMLEYFNMNNLTHDDLQDLRQQIDKVDRQIIELLKQRFLVTNKVGQYKKQEGLPAQDKAREKVQMARIEELASEAGLNPKLATDLLRVIIDEVIQNHKDIAASLQVVSK